MQFLVLACLPQAVSASAVGVISREGKVFPQRGNAEGRMQRKEAHLSSLQSLPLKAPAAGTPHQQPGHKPAADSWRLSQANGWVETLALSP